MSRPKGSKNKPKVSLEKKPNGSFVINVKMEKQLEGTPVIRTGSGKWVSWGSRNDYPAKLAELYYNSVTHKACIDFAKTAILGGGIDYDAMEQKESEMTPNYQYNWNTLLENIILDMLLFNGFSMQIIKNNDNKTYSFYHQPYSQVRCSEKNEDGVIETYWISDDWSRTASNAPIELDSFSFMEEEEIKSGKAYLYVYQDYNPMMEYYNVPHYISALKPIQTEIELERYDLRSVINNFAASGILTLNRVDSEEEKQMLIDGITSMFTGADNANSLVINFKNNDEETPATFVKIDKDASDTVDLFRNTDERVRDKIIAAHKITSKALIGYDLDGASLNGDGNTMEVAYNIYMRLFGDSIRRKIVGAINNALKLNGIETEIVLKPIRFNSGSTGTTTTSDTVDRQEDTEKATSDNNNNNLDE